MALIYRLYEILYFKINCVKTTRTQPFLVANRNVFSPEKSITLFKVKKHFVWSPVAITDNTPESEEGSF